MKRPNRQILVILVLFLGLGFAYSIINPLFESPDEVWHYEYVRWLVEGHGLPRPEQVGTAPWHQEGSQPPLYYLAAALVTAPISTDNAAAVIRYNPHAAVGLPDAFGNKNIIAHGAADAWPWRGVALAAHVARFFSLLLGAITVLSTYGTARAIFPGRAALAALAAALVAFNPQFLFLSAAVNNDNLVIAASAAGVWLSVRLLRKSGRPRAEGGLARAAVPTLWELLALGGIVGVAALAKLSGLALAGVAGLTLAAIAWRRAVPFWRLVVWGAITAAAALAVAGWWYGRNLALYGDPLGLQAMFDILPRRAAPPTAAELLARAQGVWRSTWAVFGWFNVGAAEWLYAIYAVLSLAGLAGWVIIWPGRRLIGRRVARTDDRAAVGIGPQPGRDQADGPAPLQLLLLAVWLGVMLLALINWAQMRYPQGRLLFPAISAFAVLLAAGLCQWLPRRLERPLIALLVGGLAFLALIALPRWIAPAYAAPTLLSPSAAVPNPTAADFGDQVRLAGFRLEPAQARPGDTVYLTLYWSALRLPDTDYSISVHLVDENEIIQAQHDSYPATGSLPTTDWPLGRIIPDRHAMRISETAPAPQRLRVDVGVYNYATGERLPVGGQDLRTIGAVTITPRQAVDGVRNPVTVNFSGQIALIGFDADRRVMRPGETLELTLWWEALAVPQMDYVVFAHLVLPPDAVWAGSDKMPQDGVAPTARWQPGQRIEDHHRLTLPEIAPPGVYFIEIGLYDPATVTRLPVGGSDAGISLGYVKVEAAPASP